ncbi:hypothetical protein PAHAL_8G190100 [Panicum hallii]|uniref:Reverse transcriptase zinc-binding domain-containing protein n=1 Tax=Panicum hallii TaxID=206008 RepID=A0A2T8I9F1_9POAL|nr:hypothetical protein PAHAL_8G190100 [Panicum hallii]
MQRDSYNCVICNNSVEETVDHLFFQCPFSQSCWNLLNLQIPLQASTLQSLDLLKFELHSPLFKSIFILLCWAIWTSRNGFIFEGIQPTVDGCCRTFKKELDLLQHRVKIKHKQHLEEWLNRFP